MSDIIISNNIDTKENKPQKDLMIETVNKYVNGVLGPTGGGVHTVGSASDGVNFQWNNGNIDSGKFVLYGLKK